MPTLDARKDLAPFNPANYPPVYNLVQYNKSPELPQFNPKSYEGFEQSTASALFNVASKARQIAQADVFGNTIRHHDGLLATQEIAYLPELIEQGAIPTRFLIDFTGSVGCSSTTLQMDLHPELDRPQGVGQPGEVTFITPISDVKQKPEALMIVRTGGGCNVYDLNLGTVRQYGIGGDGQLSTMVDVEHNHDYSQPTQLTEEYIKKEISPILQRVTVSYK